ncbi:DMT family transporter [Lacibacterium aquatile]|uniref:DMT family transporter n=1 Tax=Lacibacterium aquatile TaxID=1168082 RepID=A0ABW5DQC1_9PROT
MSLANASGASSLRGPLLYATAVLFGVMIDVIVKELSARHETATIFFARCAGALIVLLILHHRDLATFKTTKLRFHLLRGALSNIGVVLFFYSLGELPLVLAYVIAMSAPLMMTAMAGIILREATGRSAWIKVGIGFTGILISVAPQLWDSSSGSWVGLAACIAGTVGYAAAALAIRPLTATESSGAIALYPILMGAVLGGLYVIPQATSLPTGFDLGMMLALGLCSAMANLLIAKAFSMAPVARLAPLEYTALVWGVVIGFALFAEVPTAWVLVGAGIVVWATLKKG